MLTRAARISPGSVADTYPAILTGYNIKVTFFDSGNKRKWDNEEQEQEQTPKKYCF
ncbi:hypothetical protein TUM19329_28540 [Legionella antarctica]|uniref:Uncharacterized protein n=1 Tax=Legionella antarctica TaxID=2708020 RepID=A0A6F8T8F6_9GAMM|nr:hypothetical protein TUM19329_28540 [Legionella antarctica]